MKFLKLLVFLCVMLLFWSCGSSSNPSGEVKITRTEISGEVPRTIALLSVQGMTCAHGCGGKVRQVLGNVSGVKSTDLDFADNRPSNLVSVEFDPNVVDEKKLIETVHGIADGRYKVISVEVQTTKGTAASTSRGSGGSDSDVSVDFSSFFQVLNLLSSFLHWVK